MKINRKYIVSLVMLVASLTFSQIAWSETGLRGYNGLTKSVQSIDTKKRVIKLGDKEFSYDSSTRFVNYKGEKVSADALTKGEHITIELNTSQRYISRPLLSFVRIETAHGE